MKGHKDPRSLYQIDRLYACSHGLYFPPAIVEISPTNICNQKCRYCYSNGRIQGAEKLRDDILINCMGQLKQTGVDAVCFQGTGEPLMHKALPVAIAAGAMHSLSMGLTTNGALLTSEIQEEILQHLHYLKFSAIDMSSERYSFQHGCSSKQHDALIKNMIHAVEYRKKHNLKLGFTATIYLTPANYHDIYDVVKYFKEIGLDYIYVSEASFISNSPADGEFTSLTLDDPEFKPICDKIQTLADDDFSLFVALRSQDSLPFGPNHETWKPGFCQGIKFTSIIGSDGEVYPCYRVWGKKEYSYGSLYENTFEEIWKGERRKEIEEYINRTSPKSDECMVCGCIRHNIIHDKLNGATEWRHFL
ncbi:MAG: hypothetical protein A2020_07285 [Lentisphaerae bacterium GWF2_45_14]|nr:MAG: hypothetical protein A2020_07285 [Lentisphaerae bacterium GWF2_45_14]